MLILVSFLFHSILSGAWAGEVFNSQMICRDGADTISAQIVNPTAYYSESPILLDGALYHVEYTRDRVIRIQGDHIEEFWMQEGCGPAAVTPYQEGFLVACYSSHQLVYISNSGEVRRTWASPPGVDPLMTPNDFVQDRYGGIYFTSSGEFNVAPDIPVAGRIYYLSPSGEISEVASKINYSNGIGLNSIGDTLLVSEHFRNRILRYSVLSPGVLSKSFEVFAELGALFPWSGERGAPSPYLGPDGLRVSAGVVFVAQYAGSRILKLDEKGNRLGVIDIQSQFPNTTNIWAIGDRLYFSAVRDDSALGSDSVSPAIVGRIDDPRLRDRANLVCVIK